ncbi:MAG: DUF4439 domain-containing protein [Streptosporangiales bacterium]|nr:DUF4439 domain-containing protein [Streptosporangiales bacterium]
MTPSPSPSTEAAAVVAALQATLESEHAAIYGYGALGAHLGGTERDRARRDLDVHRLRRDRLHAMLTERAAAPAAARSAYRLPLRVTDAMTARHLARTLEQRLTRTYVALAGAPDPEVRRFAAIAAQDATLRTTRWGGRTGPFPGVPNGAYR